MTIRSWLVFGLLRGPACDFGSASGPSEHPEARINTITSAAHAVWNADKSRTRQLPPRQGFSPSYHLTPSPPDNEIEAGHRKSGSHERRRLRDYGDNNRGLTVERIIVDVALAIAILLTGTISSGATMDVLGLEP